MVILAYIGFCLLLGFFGRNRVLGFWGMFFCSMLLTPAVGLVVLATARNREEY